MWGFNVVGCFRQIRTQCGCNLVLCLAKERRNILLYAGCVDTPCRSPIISLIRVNLERSGPDGITMPNESMVFLLYPELI